MFRTSKFRHVFGTANKKEGCYEGFRLTNCASEGNFIAANSKFIAVALEVGGAGAFTVIPIKNVGRLDVNFPKVNAHREYVLDMQWNPFNDNMLATSSEDGTIRLWDIPDHGLSFNIDDEKALMTIEEHQRKCFQILWHPIASNILLSVSENTLFVWNLDDGESLCNIECDSTIWGASWSSKGDKIVLSTKKKKIQIHDARTGKQIAIGDSHEGSKPNRAIFVMHDKFVFTTGFSKMSERQYAIYDAESLEQLNYDELDTANGVLIPFYDPCTEMVYLAARGDSVIRYYEISETKPYFHYLTMYSSTVAQRSVAAIPKRSCDPNINEVMKFYKLHGAKSGYIEPLSFTVPRKSDLFQEDIYPPCTSDEAAIEGTQWAGGKDVSPNLVDMQTFFIGKKKTTSGGLKKGGLKGLKAKKEAKTTAATPTPKTPASEQPQVVDTASHAPSQHVKENSPVPSPKASLRHVAAPTSSGVDSKEVDKLKNELQTSTDKTKRLEKDVKSLQEKLKDYDKLTADIKILCDAVKKNDERIAALEGLVEESDDES